MDYSNDHVTVQINLKNMQTDANSTAKKAAKPPQARDYSAKSMNDNLDETKTNQSKQSNSNYTKQSNTNYTK